MTGVNASLSAVDAIEDGRTSLGIELGSTRIKVCLISDDSAVVLATASHEWENLLVDGMWTYSLDSVWAGIRSAYADLAAEVHARYSMPLERIGAMGISAMMHGYLAFDAEDQLLVPFRTWRNTSTERAATELSELLGRNIPLRWSVAHLRQAILDGEPHISQLRTITTLAGYVHWQLTGRRVLGIGDASGMFPIDTETKNYDAEMMLKFDRLVADTPHSDSAHGLRISELLPDIVLAGREAGRLTPHGALLLDSTGTLQPGTVLCPPEGDAGTGMIATNSVLPRTGNVSAGTSIFAMVVLERSPLSTHTEIDLVTTPAGDPVAMVHCNNGASELAAWASLFGAFSRAAGAPIDADTVFDVLLREALSGDADAGGLLAYNHVAGEPIAGLDQGRPLVVRTPESVFTLANFMRAQLYSVFGTLALGMRVLAAEGVEVDTMLAHGGMFRTAGVAQRFLAGALGAKVAVADTASEGGAWGAAVLASYTSTGSGTDLGTYLSERVFADTSFSSVSPNIEDAAGFAAFLARYRAGLAIERAAVIAL